MKAGEAPVQIYENRRSVAVLGACSDSELQCARQIAKFNISLARCGEPGERETDAAAKRQTPPACAPIPL